MKSYDIIRVLMYYLILFVFSPHPPSQLSPLCCRSRLRRRPYPSFSSKLSATAALGSRRRCDAVCGSGWCSRWGGGSFWGVAKPIASSISWRLARPTSPLLSLGLWCWCSWKHQAFSFSFDRAFPLYLSTYLFSLTPSSNHPSQTD